MKEFKLNIKTAESIFKTTGLSLNEIANADVLVVDDAIQKRIDRKLTLSVDLGGMQPRGSVYLMFKRFLKKRILTKAYPQ